MAKLLSVAEVAQFLGVSERTVFRLMKQNELHPFKMGKSWRFEETDLEAYISKLRQSSAKKTEENKAEIDEAA